MRSSASSTASAARDPDFKAMAVAKPTIPPPMTTTSYRGELIADHSPSIRDVDIATPVLTSLYISVSISASPS